MNLAQQAVVTQQQAGGREDRMAPGEVSEVKNGELSGLQPARLIVADLDPQSSNTKQTVPDSIESWGRSERSLSTLFVHCHFSQHQSINHTASRLVHRHCTGSIRLASLASPPLQHCQRHSSSQRPFSLLLTSKPPAHTACHDTTACTTSSARTRVRCSSK